MSWIVQCPKHGRITKEYHFEALRELDSHSGEEKISSDPCVLYEE